MISEFSLYLVPACGCKVQILFEDTTFLNLLSNFKFLNVNYSVKNSTVDCKYLLFLRDFFFRLQPKLQENADIADCLKNHVETHKE